MYDYVRMYTVWLYISQSVYECMMITGKRMEMLVWEIIMYRTAA